MNNSTMRGNQQQEAAVWETLQQAIADCSGFQQWQAQQETDIRLRKTSTKISKKRL